MQFFFGKHVGKNSSAQPTLRGIPRVVSLDAMLKFPGRRRCIALDFSVFGEATVTGTGYQSLVGGKKKG